MVRTVGDKKVACLMLLGLVACSGAEGDGPNGDGEQTRTDAELRQAMLQNVAQNVILAQYEDFASKAASLEAATKAWSESGSPDSRLAAQQAWKDAMSSWQRAEVYQVGPAGVMGTVIGGEDLRDEIYSWPLTSPCRVDQEIVSQDYEDAQEFFEQERVNVRGLDALEYVLFNGTDENSCSVASGINSSGSWGELGLAELDTRRAVYAHALATDVSARAGELEQAWAPAGGDFVAEFSSAGDGSKFYPSSQEALNALSDALFYIEKDTKDMKLAVPVGLTGCEDELCPDSRESRHANFSKEKMIENLKAFRLAFTGGDGEGFDDLLESAGAKELSDKMLLHTDDTIEALESWSGSMIEQLESDPDSVVFAHSQAKALGDLLKTQFVGTLDLELPARAEGDND